ncbi:MAG: AI-2E family transporter [Leptolyngbya sp. SIO3F4]|nr:AI-2E family transporter [Leptolyngbya sp. SIO3F4]
MLSELKLPGWLKFGLILPLIFIDGWLIVLLLEYFQPITSIVILASLLAFLLEFPIVFLEKRGLARGWAISLVLISALVSVSIVVLILGPLIFQQLVEFANRLPIWLSKIEQQVQVLDEQSILQNLPMDLGDLSTQLIQQTSTALKSLTSQFINLTFETINSTVNLLITLILCILLVVFGPDLWRGLLSWLPVLWQDRIRASLQPSLQNYFAGQGIIALLLGAVLSVAFTVLQIPFGLLFGVVIGISSIVPFGGTVTIVLVSGLLAFQSLWLGLKVLVAAIILGQLNENVVAPRLIGEMTGVNPAVVLIAVLIGAKVAGFLGLLLAVPTASFVKRIGDMVRSPEGAFSS